MGFDFNPSVWFICRLCKEAFPNTDQLKDHKLENHLGNCLRIKCIIFEEKFLDYGWCPNQDLNGESLPQTKGKNQKRNSHSYQVKRFQNPYVSIKRLSPEQINSAAKKNSSVKKRSLKGNKRPSSAIPFINPGHELLPTIKINQGEVETCGITQEELSFGELVIPKEEPDEDLTTEINAENTEAPISLLLNPDENLLDNCLVLEDGEFTVASFETCVDSSADLNSIEYQFPDPDQLQEAEVYSPNCEDETENFSDDPLSLSLEETVRITDEKSIEQKQHPEIKTLPKKDCPAKGTGENIEEEKKTKKSSTKRKGLPSTRRRPYSCTKCNKSFTANSSLQIHMLTHTSERPFKCTYDESVCQAAFRARSVLRKHMNTHLKVRRYKCPIPECGKTYRYASNLNFHTQRHGQKLCAQTCGDAPCPHKEAAAKLAKKFHCSECSLSFKSKATQDNHMILVHGMETDFKCRFCGKCYLQRDKMEDHERVHRGELDFKCDFANCTCAFATKPQLTKHLKLKHANGNQNQNQNKNQNQDVQLQPKPMDVDVTHKEAAFKCDLCSEAFHDKNSLQNHKSSHKPKPRKSYPCTLCDKSYSNNESLKSHVLTHTSKKPWKCFYDRKVCRAAYSDKSTLRRHLKTHENIPGHTCTFPECGNKTFIDPADFKAHILWHEKKLCPTTCGDAPCAHKEAAAKKAQKFQCSECNLTFKCKATQDNHMILVHGMETDFKCRVCGKFFNLKIYLENHERMHSGVLTFKCDVGNCTSAFATKPQLSVHKKSKHVVELGLGKFLCQLCGKPFAFKHYLSQHIKFRHEGYRPFKCTFDDSCTETFPVKRQLVEHVRVAHTGEMPYQCDKCGKAYAKKMSFETHLKVHDKGYVAKTYYDCSLCSRKFKDRQKLQVHVKSHERGTIFSCRFCNYQTCYKPVFTKHERSHMKKKDEEETDLDVGKTGS